MTQTLLREHVCNGQSISLTCNGMGCMNGFGTNAYSYNALGQLVSVYILRAKSIIGDSAASKVWRDGNIEQSWGLGLAGRNKRASPQDVSVHVSKDRYDGMNSVPKVSSQILMISMVCLSLLMAGCKGREAGNIISNPAHKSSPKSGATKMNLKDGAVMVWVPAGKFIMGSNNVQLANEGKKWRPSTEKHGKYVLDAEKPQRDVYLDGYWIYKHEVTVSQYHKFCDATNRKMPVLSNRHLKGSEAMVCVSWTDADAYCRWAGVSLPTEAQWEKAARGTDGRIYPWGDEWDASKCTDTVSVILKGAKSVSSLANGKSPYGCYNMAGNAWEWCADWYDPNYYATSTPLNPTGPSMAVKFTVPYDHPTELEGARVIRGGSWGDFYNYGYDEVFRCASRSFANPSKHSAVYGFRCVKPK